MEEIGKYYQGLKITVLFRQVLYISIAFALLAGQTGCTGNRNNSNATERSTSSEKIHFYIDPNKMSEAPVEKLTYGLFITSPWENGGDLYMNFPAGKTWAQQSE